MKTRNLLMMSIVALGMSGGSAVAAVTFTKLTGVTGGSPAGTGVYRADLTGILSSTLASITISDNSGGLGGSAGQFSGFDLDSIKLSYTSVGDASLVAGAVGLNVFDFVGGTVFTPGAQRAPADAKLFGTGPAGNTVDNAAATLGAFDAVNSTLLPFGFLSMGDNGVISFNLTSAVDVTGLYLYIGEVGDNGEVAAGSITVSDQPVPSVPDGGSTLALLGMAVAGLFRMARSVKR